MGVRDTTIIGKRFGRLTVLDFDNEKQNGRTYLICRCDCGNIKSIRRCSLIYGTTTSCGCIKNEKHEEVTNRLIGKRFGRLKVIEYAYSNERGNTYWLCECDCGERIVVSGNKLTMGTTKSCGCLKLDMLINRVTTHHMSNTRIHNIWRAMHSRCRATSGYTYDKYGGRGIYVCEEWDDFNMFYQWAMENGYDDTLTIDRINNDEGYYPENCRWVDCEIQANNRRSNRFITYRGDRHTLAEWSRILDVPYGHLKYNLDRNDISDFVEYFGVIDPYWYEG